MQILRGFAVAMGRPYRLRLRSWRSRLYARYAGYTLGPRTIVHRLARVEPRGGAVSMGADCAIHEFACLYGGGGEIALGDHVTIHPFAILYGDGNVIVGDNVQISAHVVIVSDNLRYRDAGQLITRQGRDREGVVIEDDVWIGAHACILDGVRIARGGVIGAGAVVAKSTEPYGVYVGAPARQVGKRS